MSPADRPALTALIAAMNAAATAKTPAPCTRHPAEWSSDLMPIDTQRLLAAKCGTCPVREPCRDHRQEAARLGLRLTGMVAGVYLINGKISRRFDHDTDATSPAIAAATGYTVGRIALTTALRCHADGATQASIAKLAGCSEATVSDAFRHHRHRLHLAQELEDTA